MKKTIRIKESELINILKKILNEDSISKEVISEQTLYDVVIATEDECNPGKNYVWREVRKAYQIEHPEGKEGSIEQNTNLKRDWKKGWRPSCDKKTTPVKTKPVKTTPKDNTTPIKDVPVDKKVEGQMCPAIEKSPFFRELTETVELYKKEFPTLDPIKVMNKVIDDGAKFLMNNGKFKIIQKETACEIASIRLRPKYYNKNIFIVDSINKWITLLQIKREKGLTHYEIIGSSWIIDGMSKQRNTAKMIAIAFTTLGKYYQQAKKEHPNWSEEQLDKEMYRLSRGEGGDFLPAGIYQGTDISSNQEYAGENNNVLGIKNWKNEEVSQAIHGFYKGDARKEFAEKAMKIVKNPSDLKQQEEFAKQLKNGGLKMDWSFGCINVDPKFVPLLREYGPNSFIFNIAEDNQNYLVQNAENYFDKMTESEKCLSPKALGAESVA